VILVKAGERRLLLVAPAFVEAQLRDLQRDGEVVVEREQ